MTITREVARLAGTRNRYMRLCFPGADLAERRDGVPGVMVCIHVPADGEYASF